MAFELLSRWPIHRTEQQRSAPFSEAELMVQVFTHQKLGPAPEVSDVPAPPRDKIVYNFQYDLESVWWIVLWTFLARVAYAPGQDYAPCVYINRLENTTERQLIFLTEDYLLSQKKVFDNDLHPFLPLMVDFCNELRRTYKKREEDGKVMDPMSYVQTYINMAVFLTYCVSISSNQRVPDLICLHRQEAVESLDSISVDNVETPESTSTDDAETTESTSTDDAEASQSTPADSVGASKRPRSDDDDDDHDGIKRACLDERLLFYRPSQ